MTGILLDINIVLDVFLARDPWLADSASVIQAGLDGKATAYLSAASVPTMFYLVRRNADLAKARAVVDECLRSFQILRVDRRALELAATRSPDLGRMRSDRTQSPAQVDERRAVQVQGRHGRAPRGGAPLDL
jgi:hypothetical protein